MRGTRVAGALIAVGLGLAPAAVRAEIELASVDLADVEDVEALSLEDLLEQPIVTASRYSERPASSPFLVSAIESEQFSLLGYRMLGDALRSMRGLYLTNDRNYTYLGARGFAIPGDYNTRFVLSIDGHRVNDVVYGQATPGLEVGLPLLAIERIEMLRGGAWSVYGQNALLGAIQVVTATGASRPGLTVQSTSNATAETYGDPSGRSSVAPRAQDISASYGVARRGVDVFAAASYLFDPGMQALAMPELASPALACVDRNVALRACDGVVRGGDGEEVGGGYVGVRTKNVSLYTLASRRRKLVPTGAFDTLIGDPIETFDDRFFADLSYRHRSPRADLDARLAIDHYEYRGSYPYDQPRAGYSGLPFSRVNNADLGRGRWVTGELRGRYKWARLARHLTEIEVAAGTEAQFQHGVQQNDDRLPEGSMSLLDRDDTQRVLSMTAHARARAFDHVVGFAALRGDYYPDAFGLTINPQAGFVLDLGDQGRLRASLSRGFRAPNLYELRYSSQGQLSSPDLGPEHSETRELSFERYLGKRVRLLAVGYMQRLTDLIALTTLPSGEYQYQNEEGSSNGMGAEVELEGRWDALQLRASYALQHSHNEAEENRVNSPRSLAVVTAMVPLGARATLGLETSYIGSRLTLDGTAIPPVFLTTIGLTVRDVTAGLDLSLGVRNLFDARYADPGSEEHVQSRIPADPRTVWLRLTARLGGGGTSP